jgi:hypothetical protein
MQMSSFGLQMGCKGSHHCLRALPKAPRLVLSVPASTQCPPRSHRSSTGRTSLVESLPLIATVSPREVGAGLIVGAASGLTTACADATAASNESGKRTKTQSRRATPTPGPCGAPN